MYTGERNENQYTHIFIVKKDFRSFGMSRDENSFSEPHDKQFHPFHLLLIDLPDAVAKEELITNYVKFSRDKSDKRLILLE